MVTIGDVARRAGVARSTVSQALSGKRPVNAITRARVLAAVAELGYHPNASARNLRSRRTHSVGLAIPLDGPGRTLSHGPFSQYIETIADRLSDHEYTLLCLVSRNPEAPDLARLARAGHVDGMILLQVRLQDPRIADLRDAQLPFVAIGRPADTRGVTWVDADLATAAELAVRHLLDLGHQRIAFLGDKPIFGYQYHALVGFRRAHRKYGLSLRREQVLHYDPGTGLRGALHPFLERTAGPTALITTTDIEAVMALHVLGDLGRSVPDEVSVITLGDSVLTQLAQPPITAICCAPTETCRRAVDILMEMIGNQQPACRKHLMPVTAIRRGSTSALPPRTPVHAYQA